MNSTRPNPRRRFRELIASDQIVVQPVVFDPLTALLARDHGFEAVGLGGYQMGSHLGSSEPLLCVEDIATITRSCVLAAPDLAFMVDAGAGFGEPLHVAHGVAVLEMAGAGSIHIEDQIYPKRAHYHKGVEHVIPAEEMVQKLKAAVSARQDPDLAIVARSDAMRTDDYDEGVRRARLYAEAGADLVMLFPNTDEETRALPTDVPDVPLVYVNSAGNRLGRPLYRPEELEKLGYSLAIYAIALSIAAVAGVDRTLAGLRNDGVLPDEQDQLISGRQRIEDIIGLDRHYALEAATVEVA